MRRIKSLQSAHWIGLGFVRIADTSVFLVISLVSVLAATLAGGLLLEQVTRTGG